MDVVCPVLSAVKLAVSNPGDSSDMTWHVPCLGADCAFWMDIPVHFGDRRYQGCGLVLKMEKK